MIRARRNNRYSRNIEKSGGVAEGHDVEFLLYSGERPNPTFWVDYAYPKVRSKRGFTGGSAPNGGARRNITSSLIGWDLV